MSSSTYKKMTPIEHILERPGMYIGAVKKNKEITFVGDSEKIVSELVNYSPGFLKIFDEILTNATDHSFRDSTLTYIKVYFHYPEKDMITVVNNGEGIPVELHKEYGVYIPELIFGNLLTGSNYDDSVARKGAGTNGLGSKCILDTTLLYTFDGNLVEARDVKIGDFLIGDDGSSREVLNILAGQTSQMFRVRQEYGEDYIVNGSHILSLLFGEETVDIDIQDFLSFEKKIQDSFRGKRAKPTEWANTDYLIVNEQNPLVHGINIVTNNLRVNKDYLFSSVGKRFLLFAGIVNQLYRYFPVVHNVLLLPEDAVWYSDFEFLCTHLGLYIKRLTQAVIQVFGDFSSIQSVLPSTWKSNQKYSQSTGKIWIEPYNQPSSYIGFHLGGNQRFVLKDGTVTHNCTNIYSKKFIVETVDAKNKKKYIQTFQNNMSVVSKPKITSNSGKGYTSISFLPDYRRFGMDSLDSDTIKLLTKRVMDCVCITNPKVSVYLDNSKLKGKTLEDYVKMYYGLKPIATEVQNSWEYLVTTSIEGSTNHVSFVNGNYTSAGGKHVDYIFNQICTKLKKLIEEKKKIKEIKLSSIKDKLFLFLKATVNNPSFNSQTKECLVTPVKDFGYTITVSDSFIQSVYKSPIVEDLLQLHKLKESVELSKKTDGKKTSKIFVPKLEDALWAGTNRSGECTLILTEGDSAKTFAMWGRGVVGPERFGVLPLGGKLINPRDASVSQLINNKEINNLKKILGLKQDTVYTKANLKDLRYNKVMLLVDQDLDGSHIKSLLVNFFHYWWPSLLKLDYLQTLQTPILKAIKGKQVIEFFNEGDYNKWKETLNPSQLKGYNIRYFKGLGTSTKEDAKNTFKRMNELMVNYYHLNSNCDNAILLAFNKDKSTSKNVEKCSDKRKEWLRHYDKNSYINTKDSKVSYQDLIHKELIHFSIYDNLRSIPSICDGLKPSQRKILFYMLKHNKTNLIKVAQLSGYVSAETSYHHGEASLQGAIINLAQDFVGTNNINLLYGDGNFGSRLGMGKDAASPRYIFTKLNTITPELFNSDDSPLLNYMSDDGTPIEPEWYLPVLPMVLVNGCEGIGTGYSTYIPSYNPKDILQVLNDLLHNRPPSVTLTPYFKNFGGIVQTVDSGSFVTQGKWVRKSSTLIEITEIPIGVAVNNYKEFLESLLAEQKLDLKDFENRTTDENTGISFLLEFKSKEAVESLLSDTQKFLKEMKLVKTFSTNNMYLFNENCILTKFNSPLEILKYFFGLRQSYYVKRKEYLTNKLKSELDVLENKIRFIKEYIARKLDINNKPKDVIFKLLKTLNYLLVEDSYDYLLNMPIYSLTMEKIQDLTSKVNNKQTELDFVMSKTSNQLWEIDLDKVSRL